MDAEAKSVSEMCRIVEDLKNELMVENQPYLSNLEKLYELRAICRRILLEDLDYALDRKIEQDLWNSCFKNCISELQSEMKNSEFQGDERETHQALQWFLESSTGFFLALVQEFSLLRRAELLSRCTENGTVLNQASCSYFLQYCYLHLGDLMRYRNLSREAENYYWHSLRQSPSSGQPYNQLALLEAARGDKLSTIYYYVRSITVRHPFPPAAANLQKLFSKYASGDSDVEKKSRLTSSDLILLFLKLHSHLYLQIDLKKAEVLLRSLHGAMGPLLATEKLTGDQLLKMVTITLYVLDQKLQSSKGKDANFDQTDLSQDLLLQVLYALLNCFAASSYMVPTSKWNFAPLSAVKVILDWLFIHDDVLFHPPFSRGQLWTAVAKLMNELQSLVAEAGLNLPDDETQPLEEDLELREFGPLRKLTCKLHKEQTGEFKNKSHVFRVTRLLKRAEWLSSQERNGVRLLTRREGNGKTEFEAVKPTDFSEDSSLFNAANTSDTTKGILKIKNDAETKTILTRRPRNVALTSIMRRTEDKKDDPASSAPAENSDPNRQVSFQSPEPPVMPVASAESSSSKPGGYQRSVLPPRLERLRTEQREKDNILQSLGLFSGFGTSVCSVPPPLVDITRPPPLLQPPPGMWDPRPTLPTSTTWGPGFPSPLAVGTSPFPSFNLFESSPALRGLTPGLPNGQPPLLPMQTLWKDSGPSPLERLLEQQKASRQMQPPHGNKM